MSDVLYYGSGVLPSGASSGSNVEQLTDEVSSGSINASIPVTQDETASLMYIDSGSVNGLTTFNNNFVTLSFVIIILLSAIFGTLLFSLLKDLFK